MSTGRNKHDIRAFCPPTLALINSLELERCPAAPLVPGLDSSKGSTNQQITSVWAPGQLASNTSITRLCWIRHTVFFSTTRMICEQLCLFSWLTGSGYVPNSISEMFFVKLRHFFLPQYNRPGLWPACEHTPLWRDLGEIQQHNFSSLRALLTDRTGGQSTNLFSRLSYPSQGKISTLPLSTWALWHFFSALFPYLQTPFISPRLTYMEGHADRNGWSLLPGCASCWCC